MSETAVVKPSLLPAETETTLQGVLPSLPALLPPDITAEQFAAALWLEVQGRPDLLSCTPESLRECAVKAATYGLMPGRDCHFLPFRDKGKPTKKATYVPNYQGIILALERSGKVRRAFAHPVHGGDLFEFDMFLDRPVHKPAITLGVKPGKELFYYGAVMFKDGSCAFEVMTLDELEAIKARSPSHESGPWITDRVMMCRKSALKRVAKYVRLTPIQQQMLADDDAREREDIPADRMRHNVVALFGDAAPSTEGPHRATPPAPGSHTPAFHATVSDLVPQIEALILRHNGSIEETYTWAEQKLGKPRTSWSPKEYDDLFTSLRRTFAKRAEGTPEDRPEPPPAASPPPDDDEVVFE